MQFAWRGTPLEPEMRESPGFDVGGTVA